MVHILQEFLIAAVVFYHPNSLFFPLPKLSCSSLLYSGKLKVSKYLEAKGSFIVFIKR